MVNFMIPVLGLVALMPLVGAAPAETDVAIPVSSQAPEVVGDESWSLGELDEDVSENLADLDFVFDEQEDGEWDDDLEWEGEEDIGESDARSDLEKRAIEARAGPRCDFTGRAAPIRAARQCVDRLARRGTRNCHAQYAGNTLCRIGDAKISANAGGPRGATSHCRDVAKALRRVLNKCSRAGGGVSGSTYAHGNGNFAVHIRRA